jgi:hypothetical protein
MPPLVINDQLRQTSLVICKRGWVGFKANDRRTIAEHNLLFPGYIQAAIFI